MRRYILDRLAEWKNDPRRKPLLLTGVRQCGKTYILKAFAEQYYEDYVYLNLERNPEIGEMFKVNFDPGRILQDLSNFILHKEIIPGRTLLILDEIQATPEAVTALKYFEEDMPELAVIGAGSLLGVSLRREEASFPVGKVDRLDMYPMSFMEFLWAMGLEKIQEDLDRFRPDEPWPSYILQRLEAHYMDYLIVGGMPEAVKAWRDRKQLDEVHHIQDQILYGYENDFAKHAPSTELPNLHAVWRSIPQQLAKDNNKFVFSQVRSSARAKTLETAMLWLVDAGFIHQLKKVEEASIPLSAYEDASYYKVYFADVGLLCRHAGFSALSLRAMDESSGGFRGSLTENFVLNELLCLGLKPRFWRSGNSAELDFVLEYDGAIIPIEAKANLNTQAKSYAQFVRRYKSGKGFKFSLKNVGVNRVGATVTYSVPLAAVHRIKHYLR